MLEQEIKSKLKTAQRLFGNRKEGTKEFKNVVKVLHRELKVRKKNYGEEMLLPVFREVESFLRQLRTLAVPVMKSLPIRCDVRLSQDDKEKYSNQLLSGEIFGEKKKRGRKGGITKKSMDVYRALPPSKRLGGYGTGKNK